MKVFRLEKVGEQALGADMIEVDEEQLDALMDILHLRHRLAENQDVSIGYGCGVGMRMVRLTDSED